MQPQELYWFAKAKNFGKAQEYDLFDCIECGACAYVCPSHIPLVQYYRFAKGEIWAREKEKNAADAARVRHEFRVERQEREKREKAEKLAAKEKAAIAAAAAVKSAEAAPSTAAQAPSSPADIIAAAAERAKQQAAQAQPKYTENLTAGQQAEIADIEARRAHIREIAHHNHEGAHLNIEPRKE